MGLEKNGQFRYTPPVQSMMAFHQALVELEAEGGVTARGERYHTNNETLRDGMINLGFHPISMQINKALSSPPSYIPTTPILTSTFFIRDYPIVDL